MDDNERLPDLEDRQLSNDHLAERLRSAEDARELFADLYDRAPLPYLITDRAGVIRRANEGAVALLARDEPRRLVGVRARRLIMEQDGDVFAGHRRACAATSDTQSCEVRLSDGRPVQLWTRRLAPDRRFFATLIVDLRDREQAYAQRRRLEQDAKDARAEIAARDTFIATLSHELRTPLTPVLAAVTALRARADIPPAIRDICELMRRNIVVEARLIDDLLDVTRIAHGKMSIERHPQDVHDLVRESVQMARSDLDAKSLSVTVALDAPVHFAAADPVRLKQVFWNLLKNAVKFTNTHGRIDVRSWNTTVGGRQRLAVEVSDTGIGFAPETAARLLEPFVQGDEVPARNGGLGLGLAICRGIMDLHNGHIAASSRGPGLGARFVIDVETLPSAQVPAPSFVPPGPELATPPEAKPRILLVDDHEDTAELLGELLEDAGYEVRTAHSAQSAMAVDLETIDLLVSDIGLPDTSGLDLMRALTTERPLKGIALSGYGTEADVQACKDAGFSAHLTKPVDFERLLATLREVARPA